MTFRERGSDMILTSSLIRNGRKETRDLLVMMLKKRPRIETGLHRSTCCDVVQNVWCGSASFSRCVKRVAKSLNEVNRLRRKACV